MVGQPSRGSAIWNYLDEDGEVKQAHGNEDKYVTMTKIWIDDFDPNYPEFASTLNIMFFGDLRVNYSTEE